MKDLINAINDRIKSPFYWAFIFSWIVVNWRVFVIIFNPSASGCDCGVIQCVIHYSNFCRLVLYPLVGALVYIFLFGLIDIQISKFTEHVKNEKNKIKYSEEKVLSVKFITEKRDELDQEIIQYKKDRQDIESIKRGYDTQIISLRIENENLRNKNNEIQSALNEEKIQNASFRNEAQNFYKRNNIGEFLSGRWKLETRESISKPFVFAANISFDNSVITAWQSESIGQELYKIRWAEIFNKDLRMLVNHDNAWYYIELHLKEDGKAYEGRREKLDRGEGRVSDIIKVTLE